MHRGPQPPKGRKAHLGAGFVPVMMGPKRGGGHTRRHQEHHRQQEEREPQKPSTIVLEIGPGLPDKRSSSGIDHSSAIPPAVGTSTNKLEAVERESTNSQNAPDVSPSPSGLMVHTEDNIEKAGTGMRDNAEVEFPAAPAYGRGGTGTPKVTLTVVPQLDVPSSSSLPPAVPVGPPHISRIRAGLDPAASRAQVTLHRHAEFEKLKQQTSQERALRILEALANKGVQSARGVEASSSFSEMNNVPAPQSARVHSGVPGTSTRLQPLVGEQQGSPAPRQTIGIGESEHGLPHTTTDGTVAPRSAPLVLSMYSPDPMTNLRECLKHFIAHQDVYGPLHELVVRESNYVVGMWCGDHETTMEHNARQHHLRNNHQTAGEATSSSLPPSVRPGDWKLDLATKAEREKQLGSEPLVVKDNIFDKMLAAQKSKQRVTAKEQQESRMSVRSSRGDGEEELKRDDDESKKEEEAADGADEKSIVAALDRYEGIQALAKRIAIETAALKHEDQEDGGGGGGTVISVAGGDDSEEVQAVISPGTQLSVDAGVNREVSLLRKKLRQQETAIEHLRGQLEEAEVVLVRKDDEIKELNYLIKQNDYNEQAFKKQAIRQQDRITELRKEVIELQNKQLLEEKRREQRELGAERRLVDAKQEISQLYRHLHASEHQNIVLEREINNSHLDREEFETKYFKGLKELEEAQTDLQGNTKQIEELIEESKEHHRQMNELREQMKEMHIIAGHSTILDHLLVDHPVWTLYFNRMVQCSLHPFPNRKPAMSELPSSKPSLSLVGGAPKDSLNGSSSKPQAAGTGGTLQPPATAAGSFYSSASSFSSVWLQQWRDAARYQYWKEVVPDGWKRPSPLPRVEGGPLAWRVAVDGAGGTVPVVGRLPPVKPPTPPNSDGANISSRSVETKGRVPVVLDSTTLYEDDLTFVDRSTLISLSQSCSLSLSGSVGLEPRIGVPTSPLAREGPDTGVVPPMAAVSVHKGLTLLLAQYAQLWPYDLSKVTPRERESRLWPVAPPLDISGTLLCPPRYSTAFTDECRVAKDAYAVDVQQREERNARNANRIGGGGPEGDTHTKDDLSSLPSSIPSLLPPPPLNFVKNLKLNRPELKAVLTLFWKHRFDAYNAFCLEQQQWLESLEQRRCNLGAPAGAAPQGTSGASIGSRGRYSPTPQSNMQKQQPSLPRFPTFAEGLLSFLQELYPAKAPGQSQNSSNDDKAGRTRYKGLEVLYTLYHAALELKHVDVEFHMFHLLCGQLIPEQLVFDLLTNIGALYLACEVSFLDDEDGVDEVARPKLEENDPLNSFAAFGSTGNESTAMEGGHSRVSFAAGEESRSARVSLVLSGSLGFELPRARAKSIVGGGQPLGHARRSIVLDTTTELPLMRANNSNDPTSVLQATTPPQHALAQPFSRTPQGTSILGPRKPKPNEVLVPSTGFMPITKFCDVFDASLFRVYCTPPTLPVQVSSEPGVGSTGSTRELRMHNNKLQLTHLESLKLKFCLSIDQPANVIKYPPLFAVDVSGRPSYFITSVWESFLEMFLEYKELVRNVVIDQCTVCATLSPNCQSSSPTTKNPASSSESEEESESDRQRPTQGKTGDLALVDVRKLREKWLELDPGRETDIDVILRLLTSVESEEEQHRRNTTAESTDKPKEKKVKRRTSAASAVSPSTTPQSTALSPSKKDDKRTSTVGGGIDISKMKVRPVDAWHSQQWRDLLVHNNPMLLREGCGTVQRGRVLLSSAGGGKGGQRLGDHLPTSTKHPAGHASAGGADSSGEQESSLATTPLQDERNFKLDDATALLSPLTADPWYHQWVNTAFVIPEYFPQALLLQRLQLLYVFRTDKCKLSSHCNPPTVNANGEIASELTEGLTTETLEKLQTLSSAARQAFIQKQLAKQHAKNVQLFAQQLVQTSSPSSMERQHPSEALQSWLAEERQLMTETETAESDIPKPESKQSPTARFQQPLSLSAFVEHLDAPPVPAAGKKRSGTRTARKLARRQPQEAGLPPHQSPRTSPHTSSLSPREGSLSLLSSGSTTAVKQSTGVNRVRELQNILRSVNVPLVLSVQSQLQRKLNGLPLRLTASSQLAGGGGPSTSITGPLLMNLGGGVGITPRRSTLDANTDMQIYSTVREELLQLIDGNTGSQAPTQKLFPANELLTAMMANQSGGHPLHPQSSSDGTAMNENLSFVDLSVSSNSSTEFMLHSLRKRTLSMLYAPETASGTQ